MAERFELGDEALGDPLRIAPAEVLAAELAVELPVESMCQTATSIECLTASRAFLWPRRGRSRWYWAAR